MNIKKLHLDAFGRFQNHSVELGPGFNVIVGNNEDGKSTIMAFIQMMFYGYGGRSKDLAKHLRKKYRPWQGGEMKGHILFEARGVDYRLERTFGQTNSTDEVILRNETTGELVRLPSKNDVGVEFFGLGEDAFARSVFISQGGSNIQGTARSDEITSRLSNLVTSGSEAISYQEAAGVIQQAMTRLVSKNGKNGLLVKEKQELARLEQAKRQAIEDEAEKLKVQERLAAMNDEKQKLGNAREVLLTRLRTHELLDRHDQISKAISREEMRAQLEERLRAARERFQRGDVIIDQSFLEKASVLNEELDNLLKKRTELKDEYGQLQSELTAFEKNQPFSILPEVFAAARSSSDQLNVLEKTIQQKETQILELEQFIEQAEGIKALEEAWEEARLNERDAQGALRTSKARAEQAQLRLRAQRQHLEEAKDLQMEKDVALRALNLQMQESEKRLAEAHRQFDEKIKAEEIRLNRMLQPHSAGETQTGAPRWVLLMAALLVAVLAIYFGVVTNPLFYSGLLGSLGLAFAGIHNGSMVSTAGDRRVLVQQREDYLEAFEREALNQIEALTQELEKQKQRLQALSAECVNQMQELERVGLQAKKAEDEFEKSRKLLTAAQLNEVRATDRCQSLQPIMEQEKTELALRNIQGNQMDLEGKRAELAEHVHQRKQLKDRLQSIFEAFGAKDLNEFTGFYYDSAKYEDQIRKNQADLYKLKAQMEQMSKKQVQKQEELLNHIGNYQTVHSKEEAELVIIQLRQDLQDLLKLTIQAESARSLRQDLEKQYSGQQMADQLKSLDEALNNHSETGELTLDENSLNELRQEEAELGEKIFRLDQTLASLTAQNREKYRNQPNVSQIEEEIVEVTQRVLNYSEDYEALQLSEDVLGEAFEEMQRSFGPLLNDSTATIFNRLTQGKYRQVRVNRNFDIAVEDRQHNSLREWGYLSGGTVDQAYLSLRLAISDLITNEQEPLPLFLDDVFTQYDDERAVEGLKFVREHTQERPLPIQTVLFTCHNRLRDWAKTMSDCRVQELTVTD